MLESGICKSGDALAVKFKNFQVGHASQPSPTQSQLKKRKKLLVVKVVSHMVAVAFEIEPRVLFASKRGTARESRARQIAFYLLHTTSSYSLNEIARIFGKDRTTIGHACRLVEDLRDTPAFDERLKDLEKTVCLIQDLATDEY